MTLRFLRQLLMVLTLSGVGHWILGRWALRVFPWLRAWRREVKWLLVVLTCSPYIIRVVSKVVKSELLEEIGAAAMMEFMFAALTAVPVGLIELGAALSARRRARRHAAQGEAARGEAAPG